MLQLYFRNSNPNFDLLFDSPGGRQVQSYIDQYKAAIMQEGRYDCCRAQRLHPAAAGVHDRYGPAHRLRKAIVGGRGEKQQVLPSTAQPIIIPSRVPRSKILSAYGPALDLGKITLATVIKDEPFNYSDGTPLQNSDLTYHGDVTVRQAIINSINIPAVKVLDRAYAEGRL